MRVNSVKLAGHVRKLLRTWPGFRTHRTSALVLAIGVLFQASLTGQNNSIRSVKEFGAWGDGYHDDLVFIQRAFAAVAGSNQALWFPGGTYAVSNTVVIPNKTQIIGVGRGDARAFNTVIKALSTFPKGGRLVQLGPLSGPNFGVQIKNLTIDGSGIAGVCLANFSSEELSYGEDLLLTSCTAIGLQIATSGAQNSGPFRNLEIYPVATTGVCIAVEDAISFRGIDGVTCNGVGSGSRLLVGMYLDGGAVYSNIHVEHTVTGIALGCHNNTADGMVVMNVQFGPDVATGVFIHGRSNVGGGNQNLTLLGMRCFGCTNILRDDVMNVRNNHVSLGLYTLGDGALNSKTMFSTAQGIPSMNY